MDEFIRNIIRQAQAGDPAAWERIEAALRRQLMNLEGLPVWTVRFKHEHGTDITVYQTPEDAYNGIKEILLRWWGEDVGTDRNIPNNIIDAIETYNDLSGDYIELDETRIFGRVADPGNIPFLPNECSHSAATELNPGEWWCPGCEQDVTNLLPGEDE